MPCYFSAVFSFNNWYLSNGFHGLQIFLKQFVWSAMELSYNNNNLYGLIWSLNLDFSETYKVISFLKKKIKRGTVLADGTNTQFCSLLHLTRFMFVCGHLFYVLTNFQCELGMLSLKDWLEDTINRSWVSKMKHVVTSLAKFIYAICLIKLC